MAEYAIGRAVSVRSVLLSPAVEMNTVEHVRPIALSPLSLLS